MKSSFGFSKPFSKNKLDGEFFSVYLSRLRDQTNASSVLYIENRPSLVFPKGVRVEEDVLWEI